MEKATEFDDQEPVKLPNHMLAILSSEDGPESILEALNRDGFSSEDVGVMMGADDAAKLDALCGKKGFFAKLATSGVDMGDRDTDYIKQYRKALMEGRSVIAIEAKDEEARVDARRILKSAGAHFVTYFGQFVTEVLEA
jgi:hypothetical protein